MIKPGDRVATWFSGNADGKSTVLEVRPYEGKYPGFFTHTVRVTAPRTARGWVEFNVHESDYQPAEIS